MQGGRSSTYEVGPVRGGPAVRALRRRPPLASVKPDLHITVTRATCAAPTCHATGCDQLLDLGVMHAETCVFHAGTLRALPTAESQPYPLPGTGLLCSGRPLAVPYGRGWAHGTSPTARAGSNRPAQLASGTRRGGDPCSTRLRRWLSTRRFGHPCECVREARRPRLGAAGGHVGSLRGCSRCSCPLADTHRTASPCR